MDGLLRNCLVEGVYKLDDLDNETLNGTLALLDGYHKARSMLHLTQLGLPRLRGLVVTLWNDDVKKAIISYFKKIKFEKVSIRTDKKHETGDRIPRGGYLVGVDNVGNEVVKYLNDQRIVISLEPRCRYDTLHGINALFHPDNEHFICMEVVGPGFCVSDISRGDVTPHERIRLPRPRYLFSKTDELNLLQIQRSVIRPQQYKKSVITRLIKTGLEVCQLKSFSCGGLSNEQLINMAAAYLRQTGQTLLLEHRDAYEPIPFYYLKTIYNLIAFLPEKMSVLKIRGEPFVISMTIFNTNEEIIFWDIVWPKLKYQPQ